MAPSAEPKLLAGERLDLHYVRLSQVARWEHNPKRHDLPGIIASIRTHGFRDAPIFDAALAAIVGGNGRIEALEELQPQDRNAPPRGILRAADDGEWCVPVQFGVDAPSARAAEAFAVDHNNLTAGGDLTVAEVARMWNEDYVGLLQRLQRGKALPVTVGKDDLTVLAGMFEFMALEPVEGDHDRRSQWVLRVVIGNPKAVNAVTKALHGLLEKNPRWRATLA